MINRINFSHEDTKPKGGFKLKYHATDGWRGYNDVVPPKGYKNVHSTWASGEWEDAGEHRGSEVEKRVNELHKKHGNITVVTSPTSNVFSTGVDVFSHPTKSNEARHHALIKKAK